MTPSPQLRKRIVSLSVRTLFAVGVLWLLFSVVDPQQVSDTVRSASLSSILLALMLVPLHVFLRVVRWNTLLRASGIQEDIRLTTRIVIAGYPFSTTTPGEIGDVFIRSRFHASGTGGRIPALVLLDKAVQGVFILLAGAPAVTFVLTGSPATAYACLVILLLGMSAVALKRRTLLGLRIVRMAADRLGAAEGLQSLATLPKRAVIKLALMIVATLTIFTLQEYILVNAVASADVAAVWLGYWSVMSAQLLFPFFIAGLGIRESAHVYFFGLLGVGSSEAMSASLLLFGINIVIPSLLGLVVFFFLPPDRP